MLQIDTILNHKTERIKEGCIYGVGEGRDQVNLEIRWSGSSGKATNTQRQTQLQVPSKTKAFSSFPIRKILSLFLYGCLAVYKASK